MNRSSFIPISLLQPVYHRAIAIVALLLGVHAVTVGQTYLMSNGSATTCSGTFYDSGGAAGNYSNNENSTFTICPLTTGAKVRVSFTSFDLHSSDILYVYDSNTTTNLIGSYSGTTLNGQTFTSTHASGCLTFRFVSNNSNNRAGWSATISCLIPPGVMVNGRIDNLCSGTFYDPGFAGNYPANQNITYTLCPTSAPQDIRITFTSFAVQSGADFLSIYDGIGTGTLIGTYSNANSPNGQTFTSAAASGCLTFVFTSNATIELAGWTATISCVTPSASAEVCGNGIDDDQDGFVDGFDSSCFPNVVPSCGTTGSSEYYGVLAICQYPAPTDPFSLQEIWASDLTSEGTSRSFALAGDLDGDCIPELVFSTGGNEYGSGGTGVNIASGATGASRFLISDGGGTDFGGSCAIALADVDADGFGDILFYDRDGAILRYEWNGTSATLIYKKTIADATMPLSRRAANGYSTLSDYRLSSSVGDINHDGIPEWVIGNQVFNSVNGHQLCAGALSDPIGSRSDRINTSVLVDVIGDADLDLVVGNAVYDINIPPGGTYNSGTITKVLNMSPAIPADGYVAVADMDEDGDLDVVSIVGSSMYVWDPSTGTLLASQALPGSGSGTSPTIGDVDNVDPDGGGPRTRDMEILFHRDAFIYVVKYNPITQTFSTLATANSSDASETTISLFDFQGDGQVDILYRDEDNLRMLSYDGTANLQDIVAATPCASSTAFEHPMALDVTGDGQTELVCDCGGFIRAFGSSNGNVPLIPSRRVWNQWSYFVVNINDDLSVPLYQQDHSVNKGINAFWQQLPLWDPVSQSPVRASADATIVVDGIERIPNTSDYTVDFTITNIGNSTLPANNFTSFYINDPFIAGATYLGRHQSPAALAAGASVSYSFVITAGAPFDLFAVTNDDGATTPPLSVPSSTNVECDYTNNVDSRSFVCLLPEPLLWLQADKDFTAGSWLDQTSNLRHGTNTGDPALVNDVLNFNPAVEYDGNDATFSNVPELVFVNGDHHLSIFAVYVPANNNTNMGVFGNQGNGGSNNTMLYNGIIGDGAGPLPDYPVPGLYGAFPHLLGYVVDEEDNVSGIPNSSGAWDKGTLQTMLPYNENNISQIIPDMYVGRSGTNPVSQYFTGHIAEFIIYEETSGSLSLTQNERERVQSYLAMKYGLTLAHDLFLSDASVLWSSTLNSTYNNRVTVIGRDDCYPLDQRKSLSEETGGLVTVAHTAAGGSLAAPDAFPADQTFFAFGDDAGPVTLTAALDIYPDMKLERDWKIQEFGTVGNVTLGIPQASVPTGLTHMIVYTDPLNPHIGAQFIPLISSGPDWTVEFDFTNGQYFSFVDYDHDNDGIDDGTDLDDDNDGILDTSEIGDTDGDGVPDSWDLDSDNDGIYDVVEAGSGQPFTNGVLNGAVTANGIPVSVDGNADDILDYTVADSDGDSTIDAQELDSDNDGCNDVIEAGYTDANGDGELGDIPLTVDAYGLVTSGGP